MDHRYIQDGFNLVSVQVWVLVKPSPGCTVEKETLGASKAIHLLVTGEAAIGQFGIKVVVLLQTEKKVP